MGSSKDESLMFSNEWDVDAKRFYMVSKGKRKNGKTIEGKIARGEIL